MLAIDAIFDPNGTGGYADLVQDAALAVGDGPVLPVPSLRDATRDPNVRVWATDGTADWLLWWIPDLRGRLAYDVRFELYDKPTLDRIVRYGKRDGEWQSALDSYRVVIVDRPRHLEALVDEPETRVAYRDDEIAVVDGH